MMKNPLRISLFLALIMALAILLGSCSNYRYYNRYPKPRKCGDCPAFSHRMEPTRLT
jgi:hypothetical protein